MDHGLAGVITTALTPDGASLANTARFARYDAKGLSDSFRNSTDSFTDSFKNSSFKNSTKKTTVFILMGAFRFDPEAMAPDEYQHQNEDGLHRSNNLK